MDEDKKIPQNQASVVSSSNLIAKETEKAGGGLISESIPQIELDPKLKEAGVEVSENLEVPEPTHEIIKSNIEIPAVVQNQIPSASLLPTKPETDDLPPSISAFNTKKALEILRVNNNPIDGTNAIARTTVFERRKWNKKPKELGKAA